MIRLMLMLFGVLFTSLWRPDDAPPDDPPGDGGTDETGRHKAPTAEEIYAQYKAGKLHTQDDLEHEAGKRLKREKRSSEEAKEEAERKAREQALEEQGEHKAISEQRQQTIVEREATIGQRDTRIEELEGQIQTLQTHRKANEDRATALMENVPESVKELLADRDPLKQLEWLDKNPELAGLTDANRPRGSRPTGRAATNGSRNTEGEEAAKAEHRRGAQAAM